MRYSYGMVRVFGKLSFLPSVARGSLIKDMHYQQQTWCKAVQSELPEIVVPI